MKLSKELWFITKFFDKWIVATPYTLAWIQYFKLCGTIYSSKLFKQEHTWNLIKNIYQSLNTIDDKLETTLATIYSVNTWSKIDLEDINTFDAVWSIAWIKDTNFWISVKQLSDFIKLIWIENQYTLKYNEWLLAFVDKDNIPFIITGLYAMQAALAI